MSRSLANALVLDEGESVAHVAPARATKVAHLDLIRRAAGVEGYSQDALAAAMERHKGYVSKVLGRDKPLNEEFLNALPEDVDARYARLHAEAHGYVVVEPASGSDAAMQLAAGLIGLLQDRAALPERASHMAKAAGQPRKRTA